MFIVWKIFDISINWQNSYYQNLRNISFILDSLDSNNVGFINYNDKIENIKPGFLKALLSNNSSHGIADDESLFYETPPEAHSYEN